MDHDPAPQTVRHIGKPSFCELMVLHGGIGLAGSLQSGYHKCVFVTNPDKGVQYHESA